MVPPSAERPLSFAPTDALARVRDVLRAAGYSSRGLAELIGAPADVLLDAIDPLQFSLRPRDDAPLGVLARVFSADAEVPLDVFRRAVGPSTIDDWRELGLVEVRDARVAGLVQLATSGELVLANDRLRRVLCNDYVMGTGTSTRTLDRLTVRRPSQRTLDVGTGSGILALHAAAHSEHVVAIEKNPRAVNMAAFNAALNDVTNVTVLEGDLFAPVDGQDFDLVVTNPPFIISPERGRIYRDGGMRNDELAQSIIRKAPAFLREGGFAQIVCDWAAIGGKGWQRRLRGWLEGSGCDVWVMRITSLDAAKYASFQVRGVARPDETVDELTKRYDDWLAYYEHEGIDSIHHGVITMRRRAAPVGHENWLRIDDAPEMSGACGDDVLAAFTARDFLEAAGGERRLLETRFVASPALVCEETLAPNHPQGARSTCTLRRARGLLYATHVHPGLLTLVSELDGRRTLLEALTILGRDTGERLDVVVRQHLPPIRDLIQRGFVVPAAP